MGEDLAAALGGIGPGSRVAGYLIEEPIGHGGMAVVFRALDERLNRPVALKILAPGIAADEAFRHRFIRESQAAASVDDPHIIPVYEAGAAGQVLFIAMRLVRGGDVTTLVRREGPLAPRRAAAIISAVASSLDAAHEAGLVHRDVKPANILLDTRPGRPDHVYLSDFGLSKSALGVSGITATGQFLGTPSYIAPEQISGRAIDGRADQYSLAATAFELLCGSPPFRQQQSMAVIYAHLSEAPPTLTGRRPGLPPAVDAVFARALAKDPADRFATCQQFADEMRRALGIASYDARTELSPQASAPHPPTTAVATPSEVPASREHEQRYHPPTEAAWMTPQAPPARTPVLGLPTPSGPNPPASTPPVAYQPPRRARGRGRAAAIAAALIVVLAGAGTALYLIKSSGGPGTGGHVVSWAGAHSVRPLLVLSGGARRNVVEGVAFSPDSKTLAIATVAATYLIDVPSGHEIAKLTHINGTEVKAVAFSADGKLLATADKNGRVYLWHVAGGAELSGPATVLSDPSGAGVYAVEFSPDDRTLAAGDADGLTYLWHVASGSASATPYGHLADPASAGVQGLAFTPHSQTLATGDANGRVYLWKLGSGPIPASTVPASTVPAQPAATLSDPGSRGVEAITIGPHGHLVAAGDGNGNTYLWPTNTHGQSVTPQTTLADPGNAGQFGVVAVAFSPDGRTLATGGYTGQTYLWNLAARSKPVISKLTDPGTAGLGADVQADQFSPDGTSLATGDTNGGTYLWTHS